MYFNLLSRLKVGFKNGRLQFSASVIRSTQIENSCWVEIKFVGRAKLSAILPLKKMKNVLFSRPSQYATTFHFSFLHCTKNYIYIDIDRTIL